MKRLTVILAAFFVLAPIAAAGIDAGPTPFHAATSAPKDLRAFLLSPERGAAEVLPAHAVLHLVAGRRVGRDYDFELATSRSFNDSAVLFSYNKLKIPAVAVTHQLPWMTGVPYALWAHVRWVSANGKVTTPWSAPFGFNVRWADGDVPQQLPAPEGLVRWKPIEGATRYEVLFPDIPYSFQTTTNVADEREFFTFKQGNQALWSSVRWRVRAIRYLDDKDVLKNGLPSVSYGPWSPTFTSVNPRFRSATSQPTDTVSDTWDKKGQTAPAHELDAGIRLDAVSCANRPGRSDRASTASTSSPTTTASTRSSPARSSARPAFAPRVVRRPARPAEVAEGPGRVEHDAALPRRLGRRRNGARRHRQAGPGDASSTAQGGRTPRATGTESSSTDASVDLWDSGWPTGRYYWTVVPVGAFASGKVLPTATDFPLEYHDGAVPQDQCEAGIGMSFGKVAQPVVTARSNTPWVSGLAPSGRLIATAAKVPTVHDSPLVAWQPALGATTY